MTTLNAASCNKFRTTDHRQGRGFFSPLHSIWYVRQAYCKDCLAWNHDYFLQILYPRALLTNLREIHAILQENPWLGALKACKSQSQQRTISSLWSKTKQSPAKTEESHRFPWVQGPHPCPHGVKSLRWFTALSSWHGDTGKPNAMYALSRLQLSTWPEMSLLTYTTLLYT